MSAKVLSADCISLLSKGLTFSPATHFDLFRTILDIIKFVRNVTVRRHFHNSLDNEVSVVMDDNDANNVNKNALQNNNVPTFISENNDGIENNGEFTSRTIYNCSFQEQRSVGELYSLQAESLESRTNCVSTKFITTNHYFYPVQSRTVSMDNFQDALVRDLADLQHKINSGYTKKNVKTAERIALQDLEKIYDIVICTPDKGGGGDIVVLDAGLYCHLNTSMLLDATTYELLTEDPTIKYKNILSNVVEKGIFMGLINEKQAENIVPQHPQTVVFHSFPKIPKGVPPPLQKTILCYTR